MNLPLSLVTYVHVAISVTALGIGLVVLGGMLAGRDLPRASGLFLLSSGLTIATGFLFPIHGFTPAVGVSVVSLLVLTVACYARYARRMGGRWRTGYLVSSIVTLYLNGFVLVAQLFQKVPALRELAPHQNEPPFAAAQLGLLLVFVAVTVAATGRFRTQPVPVRSAHHV